MSPIDVILQALTRLWAERRRSTFAEAAAHGAAGLCGGIVLALLLAQLGWQRLGLVTGVLALLGALAYVGWQGFFRLSRAGVARIHELAARLAEQLAPELGTSPSSAVDLARRLREETPTFSRDLAEAHLERTASGLSSIDLTKRYAEQQRRARQRILAISAGSVLLAVVALVGLKQGRARLLAYVRDPSAAELVDIPLAGDLRITYRYPTYTGLPPRVVEGGDGSISAVVGTQVELSATADESVRSAVLKIDFLDGSPSQAVPMTVEGGRRLSTRFGIDKDGRYHFALITADGERLEERRQHLLRAVPDAYPEIQLSAPPGDVELKDNQVIDIRFSARDDFGVAEVALVAELEGEKEPRRVHIAGNDTPETARDGSYRWVVAEMGLQPGAQGRFYLEVVDNVVVSGPKKTTSASRRLNLFSAQKHHEEILQKQQRMLDALVDWLGAELQSPFNGSDAAAATAGLPAQRALVERMANVATELTSLVAAMEEDPLTERPIATAFTNVLEHVRAAQRGRATPLGRIETANAKSALYVQVQRAQKDAITQNEKDIIYLDDLLAIQRIAELKRTAKDLLAAQRDLSSLLQQYKETQDPALRAELTRRMQELKDRMLGLLAKMSEIKQSLPGEYRNLEAASELRINDQLERLERSLREGDFDTAASELEQLANMIENMSNRLGEAEEEFGGERYSEVKQQLAEFAEEFKKLENEQEALAKRSEELTRNYRRQAVQQAGKDLGAVVEKARQKTAQALSELDGLADSENVFGMSEAVEGARQRLIDLDGLLAQRDFAEAREMVQKALQQEDMLRLAIDAQALRDPKGQAQKSKVRSDNAKKNTQEVADILDKLFPDPKDVLSPEQQRDMKSAAKRQSELEQRAEKLGQQMDQLSSEVPLFGGEPRANLQSARSEMNQSKGALEGGELPEGSQHSRRAAEALSMLREALEQASKGGKGGMPLPLGTQGQSGGRRGEGGFEMDPSEDVYIPDADKNRAAPRFRKDLLEAAKQKPPQQYEEAVRKYYEELIR